MDIIKMKFLDILNAWVQQPADARKTLTDFIKAYETKNEIEIEDCDCDEDDKILSILKQVPEAEMSEFNMFYFEKVHNKHDCFDDLLELITENNLLDIADAVKLRYLVNHEWADCTVNGGFLSELEEYIFNQYGSLTNKLSDKLDEYEAENIKLGELVVKQQKTIDELNARLSKSV